MPGRFWWKDNGSGKLVPNAEKIASDAIGSQQAGNEFKGTAASVAVGLSGVYGANSTISPSTGYSQIDPKQITFVLGGSFAMSENVTVRVTANYTDGSTAGTYTHAAFTGTGTTNTVISDFSALIKTNVGISSLVLNAKTDQASTSATVSVTVYGINLV